MLQLFLLGYALTFDIKQIPFAVRDLDDSVISRELTSRFTASNYFHVRARTRDQSEVDRLLNSGVAKVALIIPRGFGNEVKAGHKTEVQILVDGSDPNIARVGTGYSNAIVRMYSNSVSQQSLFKKGAPVSISPPIDARRRVWYNPEMKSSHFIIPGLIAIIMMTITGIETSVAIVREKEKGTLENLIISPMRPIELIIGKIVPFLGLAGIEAILISVTAVYWFGVPMRGSVLFFFFSLAVYLMGTLGIGLFISAITDSQQVASLAAMLATMLPAFLLSGYIFPIRSMPYALQLVTYFVPARYFIVVMRGIFLKGTSISILWPELLALGFFGVAILSVSTWMIHRRLS